MDNLEEKKETEELSGASIKEQRKNNRLFGLFLILSLVMLAFIATEIVLLVLK